MPTITLPSPPLGLGLELGLADALWLGDALGLPEILALGLFDALLLGDELGLSEMLELGDGLELAEELGLEDADVDEDVLAE